MNNHVLAAMLGATALIAGAGVPAVAQTVSPFASARDTLPPPAPMRGGLMRADADGDGVVTRAEAIADADRRFAALDTDGDGKISRDERQAARDARRGPPPAGANGTIPPSPPEADRAAPPPRAMRPHRNMRPQTRDEARDRALRLFDRADTNHDGRVDQQDMDAMRLLMRARVAGADGDDRRGPRPEDEQR